MRSNKKKLLTLALALLLVVAAAVIGSQSITDALLDFAGLAGYEDDAGNTPGQDDSSGNAGSDDGLSSGGEMPPLDEDGFYYSKEAVSRYLHEYGKLPANFITKAEAQKLGWDGGSVEQYKPGYAIGGDVFGNREGLLPKAEGRKYYECDIDTNGGKERGAKRIVFSNDGLIFYTDDHYATFTQLYGGTSQ